MRSPSESRLVTQAYRFELDPNNAQRELLAKSVGASRFVYNWGLAESNRAYELTGKRPRRRDLQAALVPLKQGQCPWLYEISAHIGQQALVDLERAFEGFFQGLKAGPRRGFPRFKRKGERDSARLYEVELSERKLRLPMIGQVRLKETRSARGFEGRILSATISRKADRWFCSLAVEREREVVLPRAVRRESDVAGVDLGLKAAAVIHSGFSESGSDVWVVEPARALRSNLAKLRRLDRRLARKQRGSGNRRKAQLRRARLHYKISCQRNNFLHHLSGELARTKPVVVLENLNVHGMMKNRSLALSIGDAGMGELRRQLAYKCDWYGSTLVVLDRFFPSTQLCSGCGVLNGKMKGLAGLKERQFDCPACGLSLDRDENAALNIRRAGLLQLDPTGLGSIPLPEGFREEACGEGGSGRSTGAAKPASVKQEAKARRNRAETRRSTRKLVKVPV